MINADESNRSSLGVNDGYNMFVSADVNVAFMGGISDNVLLVDPWFWSHWDGNSGKSDRSQCRPQEGTSIGGRLEIEMTRLARRNGLEDLVPVGVSESAMSTGRSVG